MASAPAGPGMAAAAPEVKVYYGKPMQLDVSRVLACLYEKDVNFKPIDMFQGKPMPELIKLQASTRAQVIGFEDGPIFLHDSRAICRYVAEKYADRGNKYLLGRDLLDRASIEQWLKSEEQSFDPPSRELIFYIAFGPHTDNCAPNRDLITQSEQKLAKVLDIYEQRLSQSRYLAGDEFTLADLNHLPNSYYLATTVYRDYLFDKRTNIKRWWKDISDRPSWTKVAELMTKDTRVEVKKEPTVIEKDASKSRKPSIEVKKDVASTGRTEKVFLVPPPTSSVSLVSPSTESPKTQSDAPLDIAPTSLKRVPTSEQAIKVAPLTKETTAAQKAKGQPALEAPTPQEAKLSTETSPITPSTESFKPQSDTPQHVVPTATEKVRTSEQAQEKSTPSPPLTDELKGKSSLSQFTAEKQPSDLTVSKSAEATVIFKESAPSAKQSSTQTNSNSKGGMAELSGEKPTAETIQNLSSVQTKEATGSITTSQTSKRSLPEDITTTQVKESANQSRKSTATTEKSIKETTSYSQTTMRTESADNTTPDKLATETTVSSQTTARTEITDNTTTKQAQAPDKSKLPPPKTDESKAKSPAISQPTAETQPSKEPASSETQSSTQTSNKSKRTTAALSNGKTTTEAIQNSSSIQAKEPTVSNGELSSYDTSTSEMSKESLSTKKARSQEAQKAEKSVAQSVEPTSSTGKLSPETTTPSRMTGQTPSISETTGTRTQPGVANTTESTQSPNSSNFEAKTDPSIDSDSKSDSPLQS